MGFITDLYNNTQVLKGRAPVDQIDTESERFYLAQGVAKGNQDAIRVAAELAAMGKPLSAGELAAGAQHDAHQQTVQRNFDLASVATVGAIVGGAGYLAMTAPAGAAVSTAEAVAAGGAASGGGAVSTAAAVTSGGGAVATGVSVGSLAQYATPALALLRRFGINIGGSSPTDNRAPGGIPPASYGLPSYLEAPGAALGFGSEGASSAPGGLAALMRSGPVAIGLYAIVAIIGGLLLYRLAKRRA